MIKTLLLEYPLAIKQVDKLIIFMVYYQIETIEDLLSKPEEEFSSLEGWTNDLKETIKVVRDNYSIM